MRIEYYQREVFGNKRFYVKDAATREAIKKLTRRESIERADISALETLGHKLEKVVQPD